MIKKFGSVAEVVNTLGDVAKHRSKCQICQRDDVTTYPLLALRACAACIVVNTGGAN